MNRKPQRISHLFQLLKHRAPKYPILSGLWIEFSVTRADPKVRIIADGLFAKWLRLKAKRVPRIGAWNLSLALS